MFFESGSLGAELSEGVRPWVLTFGSQDPTWLAGLDRLLLGRTDDRIWVDSVLSLIEERLAERPDLCPSIALLDRSPNRWLVDVDPTTAPAWTRSAPTCLLGTALSQLVATRALAVDGLDPASATLVGHSTGLLTAWTVARHGAEVGTEAAADLLMGLAITGEEAAAHPWSVTADALPRSNERPAPMLAVAGMTEPRLMDRLADCPADDEPVVALQNSWDRFVISGSPADLERFSRSGDGRLAFRAEWLPSPVPFHHPGLMQTADRAIMRIQRAGIRFDGKPVSSVVDPRDASDLSAPPDAHDRAPQLIESLCARPVRWADTLVSTVDRYDGSGPNPVVIDVGPSVTTARLTERSLRGTGATVIALGDPGGARSLALAAERPESALDYRAFTPGLRESVDGSLRLRTRHTDWCGRSPVVLAGMTPTTVDANIVAAAANAGHVAELAGGGQVTTAVLDERLIEVDEQLLTGGEIVFNALYLDPYLWNLHLGRERGVLAARSAGAPVCGVTVSAGVPDPDEAAELLRELNAAGVWLNSFKPGDVDGVLRVLEIADATPERIWIHLEGGLAGGHHGWSDLEQVLVATYHDVRRRANVALAVGGGIGDPARAATLLDGTWSLAHSRIAMPVDAVLIGTAAMATAESTASSSVKEALVAAAGTTGAVRPGTRLGGVTSGRSSLGADIHYLDNHASRVASMLDDLAGDGERIAEHHDEIAEALDGTAKPWFGDLTSWTYEAVLERFVELTAIGRHGRYEDGRWLDPTHRTLFLELLRHWEARCCDQEEGTIQSIFGGSDDVDDPTKAIERLVNAYPVAAISELDPADAARFIDLCERPGKPVPFVAAIDADVRRRYLADSLWQSHSDLYAADEVLVIPGPAAVSGIVAVDEPVADLLGRFEAFTVHRLISAGLAADRPVSTVETLIRAHTLLLDGRRVSSPVQAMAAGGEWTIDTTDGLTSDAHVTARLDHGAESLILRGPAGPTGDVTAEVTWPALPGLDADGSLTISVNVEEREGVAVATIGSASFYAAQSNLLAMLVRAAGRLDLHEPDAADSALSGGMDLPDWRMRRLWPELFASIGRAGGDHGLLRLVHLRHAVEHAPDPDVTGLAGNEDRPNDVAVRRTDAGIEIRTTVTREEWKHTDTFLVRGASGVVPTSDEAPTEVGITEHRRDPAEDADRSAPPRARTPRLELCRTTRRAPSSGEAFAALSGDANPLHRSDLIARLAGLPRRIVHGMWTSIAAQEALVTEVLGGRTDLLTGWDLRFTDVVEHDDEVTITATRVATEGGDRIVEVEVSIDGRVAAIAEATVAPVRTAYVFPGQGIQHRGMGQDSRERSAAAADVWERAESYCRSQLGFSLDSVVRENPPTIVVRPPDHEPVTHRHADGVLYLTQFTQVAMATLAAAQVAEMRESGVFDDDAVLAGHSVGEYNALAAIGGVLPLDAVLGVVWARGSAMHDLVPRGSDGASGYRLAAIRPHLAGLDESRACDLVAEVAAATGELCEVVNHNLRGRQYAVAGTVGALAQLERRLGTGTSPGRSPYIEVPGIDVPFHSRALADGVEAFRDHLDHALPEEIDPSRLVGRYVPNLHPIPFELDRTYAEGISEACDGRACQEVLRDWDELVATPARLARQMLVELLAWQFASPVRWIETTDVMLDRPTAGGLGVERVVEVGVGSAPTLANLTKAAVSADGRTTEVLHVELDRIDVFELHEPPEEMPGPDDRSACIDQGGADLDADWDGDAPGPLTPGTSVPDGRSAAASVAHPPASTGATAAQADVPVAIDRAVPAVLAMSAGVRLDQLADDSIDRLVDGASSRRNQVLMDLGRELGIGAVDGAHEMALSDLLSRLDGHVGSHRHPGPVLSTMIDAGVAAAMARAGSTPARIVERVRTTWGLGDGWVAQCRLEIALGTRDGTSRRGGPLSTLSVDSAEDLIDDALATAAQRLGVTLVRPSSGPTTSVDGAAVDAVVRGVASALSEGADAALHALAAATGLPLSASDGLMEETTSQFARLTELDAEHGPDRAEATAAMFDPARVQLFASSTSWARADLDRLVNDAPSDPDERRELVLRLARFHGSDDSFDATLNWYRSLLEPSATIEAGGIVEPGSVADDLARIADGRDEHDEPLDVAGLTVVVSGASPGSIGESVVAQLLGSGATVVVLTSSMGPERRRAWRSLERRHAGPGSRLFVVPANLASFRDIDVVLDWLDADGSDPELHPGRPDVVLPFAAPSVLGDAPDAGARHEVELRVMLLGVERLVAGLAERAGAAGQSSVLTAVLPMSPNHGVFGGDGAYGHAKAGLEVLAARRVAESARWGRWCRIVGVEIGWVRGTGLMGAHDALAPIAEDRLGITTHTAAEVGRWIAELCAGAASTSEPGSTTVALAGGLDRVDPTELAELVRQVAEPAGVAESDEDRSRTSTLDAAPVEISVLPSPWPPPVGQTGASSGAVPLISLDEMVVICGISEIGPWGTSATRADAERTLTLSPRAVQELAVRCSLIKWSAKGSGGCWVDVESGDPVEESEISALYRDEVLRRSGIRAEANPTIDGEVQVFVERPVTFDVSSEADARSVAAATPGSTIEERDGSWSVRVPAGSALWAPRTVELPRSVTARITEGMDPTGFGVPTELAESIDKLAAWNLVTTAEAFRDAGTTPEELLERVSPARVANTQGTGMGGMDSIRTIHLAPRRRTPHANDVLQEALGNVVPAHAMQSFIGGTGPMIHPVAACATAGVSLELAVDLVRAGKADVVIGGGFDDIGPEGINGFAEMSATADDAAMSDAGFEPCEMSRPGDRSRAGFVESQGGGSFVVCRGSLAADLGLPVRAVVVHASSHADGFQTSIPAPGPGALSVVDPQAGNPLARALSAHGLVADDIGVVSKHDTSTRANDPNEADIHERIQAALGRSPGNPLRVVSQKALTGHAKGGSALWQIAGLCDVFDDGVVPGNPNLDSIDPDVQRDGWLVVDDRPLRLAEPPRAALLTSLGFGHVSVLAALAGPAVFLAALRAERGDEATSAYGEAASLRRRERDRDRRWSLVGRCPAFRRRMPA